jgi:hypothetical protein
MNENNLIKTFKQELIEQIKKETEREIQVKVKEFEQHLRETTSAKIVSFVDNLKVIARQDLESIEPKVIIEVHL